ncbi:glycine cleavage system P-protein-domain-containing protein [Chaetomium strumarium]|uniref:Glycine cleavage system P protein n=1 Tax=Chaetomium strumarium TaxID=1170767 RepID=A0AAJ0M7D4_9PEZI|nr:glycine cleavage system P-protein-domain-containing protein [Chaetomium strumarium]
MAATTTMAVLRRIGRLNQTLGASVVLSRAAAPRGQPWVCSACSRSSQVRWNSPPRITSPHSHFARFPELFPPSETFVERHIGPDDESAQEMLKALSPPAESLDSFIQQVIPAEILSSRDIFPDERKSFVTPMQRCVKEPCQEWEIAAMGRSAAEKNPSDRKNFIGAGYYGTITPEVIKRNVLESPAWYTSYTPYQPEISQGRLESLLNFQTLVSDLTALPISNASLLDEGTAAAEAMTLSMNALPASRAKLPDRTYVVDKNVLPQTLNVLRSRAEGFGINVRVMDLSGSDYAELEGLGENLVGALVQYPDMYGGVRDFRALADVVHKQGALLSAATDLLALTLLTPPGEWGADIAFGNAQRFGVPLGFGGPHAAFFAVKEKHKRKMPGRLVGVSKDRLGRRALRLSLQTREQHIRREKATSNVCTAQALLANISAFYAVYHGPKGLKRIAERCRVAARVLQLAARYYGFDAGSETVAFDTVVINCPGKGGHLAERAKNAGIHIRCESRDRVVISVDETVHEGDLLTLIELFNEVANDTKKIAEVPPDSAYIPLLEEFLRAATSSGDVPEALQRQSAYLTHPVFNSHHSETELLRYIHHLQSKDLSLVHSMIPLGSCTMKLNGSTEMSLITLPGFSNHHPAAPPENAEGYVSIIRGLKNQLKRITAMDAVSLQPNSGAQGEFAGLRAIRKYHESKGQSQRDLCLIPVSAHGTNPASAAMAGMRVLPIKCDAKTGNLDLEDLEAKCAKHASEIGAMMVTYPSTYGVFEPHIKRVCEIVHAHGGQVYMDGANMNAQIGLCSPGEIGADVCHLNLHKTFCIPHGGGGPGVGPICVKEHLARFLPTRQTTDVDRPNLPVASAPFGSASILPISWAYNALMGGDGLRKATKITLLNANYLLSKLKPHYPILYTNEHGRCAHEFILDVRKFSESAGVEAIDIAKRLQDYGFHAPTMSWPVPNTLMIEPTESESKEELDRFVDAMVSIREEIREIEEGRAPREGNVLKMAPHPMVDIIQGDGEAGAKWDRPYTREKAAYPLPWLREKKFWPSVARVDDTYGDLNLFCTCPPVEDTTGGHMSSIQAD